MLLFPAIDLMDGCAVRLRQGLAREKTVYSDDPVAVACEWQARGGDWLHVVDLDAAFTGTPRNLDLVRRITAAVDIPVQLGGGLRDEAAIDAALSAGVARVVIGTRAAEAPDFVERAVARFGGDHIAVGLDAREGRVAVKGWTQETGLSVLEFAPRMAALGVSAIIYTDIATDGMLRGPNLAMTEEVVALTRCSIIASGGVASARDLVILERLPGLVGAIIGRALFEGCIRGNLREAMRTAALEGV